MVLSQIPCCMTFYSFDQRIKVLPYTPDMVVLFTLSYVSHQEFTVINCKMAILKNNSGYT